MMKLNTGFFVLILLSCSSSNESSSPQILWENNNPVGLTIPNSVTGQLQSKNVEDEIVIRLQGDTSTSGIFGRYENASDAVIFKPLIPFTRGLTYEIYRMNKKVASVMIPLDSAARPYIKSIYPSNDTLPENLLKMYVSFNKPMKRGDALKNIVVLTGEQDTVYNPFLELNPELWDQSGTILTLWVDPGRVKRDLQPNKLYGLPMMRGNEYRVVISGRWTDTQGTPMETDVEKKFYVTTRDSLSPKPEQWKITSPKANSTDPLIVNFYEPLDFMLIQSAMRLLDNAGIEVQGNIEVKSEERQLNFYPASAWQKGTYTMFVENRLEDLAGNNLSRPFDRDLMQSNPSISKEEFYKIEIIIR